MERLVPPELREEAVGFVERARAGEVVRAETERLAKDGRRIPTAFSLYPIPGPAGEPLALAAIIHDISARKRAEEVSARLAAIVQSSSNAILSVDLEGRVTAWNPGAERVFGYAAAEMIGQEVFLLVPPGLVGEARDFMARARRGESIQAETVRLTKDGHEIPVTISLAAIPGPGGEPVGLAAIATDISARKQAEQEREKLAAIVESASDAVFTVTPGGTITSWNTAAERMFGYTAAEAIGMSALVLSPEEELEQATANLARIAAGEDGNWEGMARAKDGHSIDIAGTVFTVRIDGGTVLAAIIRDVSERKRAEQARDQMAAIVETSEDAIFTMTPEGAIVTWNAAAERMFGYAAEEIAGKNVMLLSPPDMEAQAAAYLQTLATGETIQWEGAGRAKDGHRVEISGTAMHLGKVSGHALVAAIVRDITERVRAEEALRESEVRYRMLIDSSPYGIGVQQDGKVAFVNKAGTRILGASSPEELAGREVREFVRPDRWETVRDRIARMTAGEPGLYPVEDVYVRVDGTEVPVEVTAAPFIHDGRPAVQMIVTDITERKKAEEEKQRLEAQLQHTQKLESLGVLAGGIAHDFNNLLLGILGNAGLAMDELPPASPARETVRDIEAAAIRAADLTRQLLAYSGRARFVIEPIDLATVVREMVHLLEVSISKKAQLVYAFEADLPAIQADPTQLRQVVMNLITNASDAIGDNPGTITVRTATVEADRNYLLRSYVDGDLPPGLYVCLEVVDTGTGMDQATMERIFEPFFTTKFTGRGLGMASVLGIVRAHRGAIMVESEPGKGSTFRVLFPATEAVVSAPKPEVTAPAESLAGRTVLVVDDDDVVRKLTARVLEGAGADVVAAANGREALELFKGHALDFDLVLLDLTMPEMDGAETYAALREIDPSVRVVLSSGYGEQEAFERFDQLGLAGFIQKPYLPGELLTLVLGALEAEA